MSPSATRFKEHIFTFIFFFFYKKTTDIMKIVDTYQPNNYI